VKLSEHFFLKKKLKRGVIFKMSFSGGFKGDGTSTFDSLELLTVTNVASHLDWESTQRLLLVLHKNNKRYLHEWIITELKKLTTCPIVLEWLDNVIDIDACDEFYLPFNVDPESTLHSVEDNTTSFTYKLSDGNSARVDISIQYGSGRYEDDTDRMFFEFYWMGSHSIKEVEAFLTYEILQEVSALYVTCIDSNRLERAWAVMASKPHLTIISDPFVSLFRASPWKEGKGAQAPL
jgi:hypothetical protein